MLRTGLRLSTLTPLRRARPQARGLATHVAQDPAAPRTRHDWSKREIQDIYDTPLLALVFRAAAVHRAHHDPAQIQLCTLMNIKSASFP